MAAGVSETMRVSCLDVWTARIQEEVRACLPSGFSIRFARSYDPDEQRLLAAEADFLLTGWAEVTGAMMAASPRLLMIQKWGVGIDRIDLEAAEREGVAVAVTAGANASAVAEHANMLMLAVFRRLSFVDRATREGRWVFAEMRERCFQLRGKTVGLLGFGHIGRAVARKLAGFEVSLVYCDPVAPDLAIERALAAKRVSLDELLATSDVVSLHLPGGGANRHLIGPKAFGRMKEGAILINTARGDVVDPTALCEALRSGRLMGAGLDVFDPEPPSPQAELLSFDQVVLTPHTAGSVLDNVGNVARHAFGNMLTFWRGEALPPADVVVAPRRPRAAERGAPAATERPS
jgi:D-3-phosphoglycerate dehydrogenase